MFMVIYCLILSCAVRAWSKDIVARGTFWNTWLRLNATDLIDLSYLQKAQLIKNKKSKKKLFQSFAVAVIGRGRRQSINIKQKINNYVHFVFVKVVSVYVSKYT